MIKSAGALQYSVFVINRQNSLFFVWFYSLFTTLNAEWMVYSTGDHPILTRAVLYQYLVVD